MHPPAFRSRGAAKRFGTAFGNGDVGKAFSWSGRTGLAHRYEIRIQSPDGKRAIIWDVERTDDVSAVKSAVEVCQNQVVEVWDGGRQIAAVSLSGPPRVTL